MNLKEEIKALKNELRNCSYYMSQLNKTEDELDVLWYKLSGVKSPDPSKIPIESHNPSVTEEMRLEMLTRVDELENKRLRLENNIQHINYILSQFEDDMREPVRDIYIRGKTFYSTGIKHNINPSYLQYRIDKNFSDIIKKGGC